MGRLADRGEGVDDLVRQQFVRGNQGARFDRHVAVALPARRLVARDPDTDPSFRDGRPRAPLYILMKKCNAGGT